MLRRLAKKIHICEITGPQSASIGYLSMLPEARKNSFGWNLTTVTDAAWSLNSVSCLPAPRSHSYQHTTHSSAYNAGKKWSLDHVNAATKLDEITKGKCYKMQTCTNYTNLKTVFS